MSEKIITVPDHQFSGFYYPEILLALLEYARVNTPELSSELEYELHVQMLRAFALVGHLNNTRLDIVANEMLLDSAQLPESVRKLFKLIDCKFNSATSAKAECVIKLSRVLSTDVETYIRQFATVSTERIEGEDVSFEVQEPLKLSRGDELGGAYSQEALRDGTDGEVNTSAPNQFYSPTGGFSASDIGRTLFVWGSISNNGGEYIITSIIDANTVKVNKSVFTTEVSLEWWVLAEMTDYTSEANTDLSLFPLWSNYQNQSLFYCGHDNIQWDQMDLIIDTVGQAFAGVWEYYDPTYGRTYPNEIIDLGGNIRLRISSLLGVLNRTGAFVTVTYNLTGETEQATSFWATGISGDTNNFIETKGLLGQSTVDLDPLNYTVKVDWVPLENLVDGTSNFQSDGEISYKYPMSANVRWVKNTIAGKLGFWMRYRGVEVTGGSPTPPVIDRIKIDGGNQYFPFDGVQGETIRDEILGSSSGLSNQKFELAQIPLLDNTLVVEVDETGGGNWEEWVEVENFFNSKASDRHYKLDRDYTGLGMVIFSNGTNGRIPPLGSNNIRAKKYRIGGDKNGNVGAEMITGNDGGLSYVEELFNPMPASGWAVADGVTSESLEKLKETGPASIRNQERAAHLGDVPRIAISEYRNSDGGQVVLRAFAIEEAYGPKTVQLVCVGIGGQFLSQEDLEEIKTYFNGDKYSIPPAPAHWLLNYELNAVNYEAKEVDVTVEVVGKGLAAQQIENGLTAYLNPLATDSNGDYVHNFGGRVPIVGIDCAIKQISKSITNVHRSVPSSDVLLGDKQLPVPGTIVVSVVESE